MLRKTWMLVVVVWGLSGTAWAQVAMLTQVTGEVRVAGKDGARAAVPFLKVNEGDKLTLGGNARVQMVYLNTGRQEIWKGSGQVDVGSADGRSSSLKADASQLPALVLKQLEKTPAARAAGEDRNGDGPVAGRSGCAGPPGGRVQNLSCGSLGRRRHAGNLPVDRTARARRQRRREESRGGSESHERRAARVCRCRRALRADDSRSGRTEELSRRRVDLPSERLGRRDHTHLEGVATLILKSDRSRMATGLLP